MNPATRNVPDWKIPFALMCIIAAAVALLFTSLAHAAGLAATDPTPALTTATDVGIATLTQDGPWWLAIAVLHVVLRTFLDREHWLKQGYLLSGLTALAGVSSAVVAWHWLNAPSVGIITAAIAGFTLLMHPVPATTEALAAAKSSQAGFALKELVLWLTIGGIGIGWIAVALGAVEVTSATGCKNPKVQAVDHALWDCTAPERAAAVDAITPTVVSVIKAAGSADGKLIDTSTVKSAIVKANVLSEAGVLLSCALASAVAILTAPAPAPASGAPAASPYVLDPAAVAAMWVDINATQLGGARFIVASGRVQ